MCVYTIEEIAEKVRPIAIKYGVEKVYLFGSYARGEATEESDVDLRVDGENCRSLIELSGLFLDIEEALDKSLDLVTTSALRQNKDNPLTRSFIRNIKREEKLIYERCDA